MLLTRITKASSLHIILVSFFLLLPMTAISAMESDEAHDHDANAASTDLKKQVSELQHRIHKLEAAVKEKTMSSGMNMSSDNSMNMKNSASDMSMGMGGMKMGMGMGDNKSSTDKMGMMKMMQGKKMKGMKMGMGMMKMMGGMDMMGMSGSDQQMTMVSALPGFPGASHIYHIGSTGFFLNHADHLKLNVDQETRLNAIKEQALLKQSTHKRSIEELEQELWQLTAAGQPDAAKIDAKIKEIATHTADKRMDFIKAVGSAASVLTEHQRHVLAGTAKSDAADVDHSSH